MNKKLFLFGLTFFSALLTTLCGCKSSSLKEYISEYRYDVLTGENDEYKIKAYLIECEQPLTEDGKVGEKKNFIRFYLYGDNTEDLTFNVKFTTDKEYDGTFSLNSAYGTLICVLQVTKITLKTLPVTLSKGSDVYSITLNSIVPKNTISIENALKTVKKEQSVLIESFSDGNGNLDAEISARILIKNDKAYWYVAFVSKNFKKALLIDSNGKILAVRDIFS